MSYEIDKGLSIKFEAEGRDIILNKDVKVIDFLNKKVQVTYNLN